MQQKLPQVLFFSGCVLLVAILLGGWVIFPSIFNDQVQKETVLENGTKVWEEWTKDKLVYFKVYIFNVTNPQEIEAGGEPSIQELGPYVYNKTMERILMEANVENDTILFKDIYTYHFNDELSNGSLDDEIVVLNMPFLAVSQQLSTLPYYVRFMASTYLSKFKSQVFVRRTVREYLFEGTYEPMISELEIITGQVILPNSTFGVFYGANGTVNGLMEIKSGKKDISEVGAVISMDGKTELDFWEGKYCNMMNGTDATVYPPFVTKNRNIYLFIIELCRSIHLTYHEEVDIHGVSGYRFLPSKSFLDAPKDNPDNRCFCSETDIQNCLGKGVYSIKSCRNGAPLVLSTPHFVDGETAYAEKFALTPNRALHQSRLTLEPNTGAPLEILKRVQINAEVKRLSSVVKYKEIQNMIFPLIWIDEDFTMTEEMTGELERDVLTPLKMIEGARWLLVCCSFLLIITAIGIFVVRTRRKSVFV